MAIRLKEVLENMEISIDELSLISRIDKKRLLKILSGDSEMFFSEAIAIVSSLNISFDDLISDKKLDLDEKFNSLLSLGLTKNMLHLAIFINGYNEETYKKLKYFATGKKD